MELQYNLYFFSVLLLLHKMNMNSNITNIYLYSLCVPYFFDNLGTEYCECITYENKHLNV